MLLFHFHFHFQEEIENLESERTDVYEKYKAARAALSDAQVHPYTSLYIYLPDFFDHFLHPYIVSLPSHILCIQMQQRAAEKAIASSQRDMARADSERGGREADVDRIKDQHQQILLSHAKVYIYIIYACTSSRCS